MTRLDAARRAELLAVLEARFTAHPERHPDLTWDVVAARLDAHPKALTTLSEMERTGGEPDVVAVDRATGEVVFVDCAEQSPSERRSVCYDAEALESRKKHRPDHSAMGMAAEMGVELLDEEAYHRLQTLGEFDTKTSSWLRTPADVRDLGGAIFGDRRFGRVFIYHNGVESYYAARGFRGVLRV